MHILVIFTGGTIGSAVSDGWIAPDDTAKYTLINTYRNTCGEEVLFSVRTPYTILSENLSGDNLTLLASEVCKALTEAFDGIIVTHGTDTLPFTAAALAYATGNDCKPVVLVSSNHPLTDPRANGNHHFKAAVEFIQQQSGRGVFVAYKNGNNAVTFHNALSVVTHLEADDKIFSLYDEIYATATESGIAVTGTADRCEQLPAVFTETADILVITAHPADNYAYPLKPYKAVLLRPYHSGTLPTDLPAFTAFCQSAKAANVPLYAVNIPRGTTYESSKAFAALGIIPLYDTTFASAFIKLWMQLS